MPPAIPFDTPQVHGLRYEGFSVVWTEQQDDLLGGYVYLINVYINIILYYIHMASMYTY